LSLLRNSLCILFRNYFQISHLEKQADTSAKAQSLLISAVIRLITKREKVLDIGSLQATAKKKETIPLPPVLGAVALIGGVALVFVASNY
jgi:hypothetical protein